MERSASTPQLVSALRRKVSDPEGCGSVALPPCAKGFLIVWVTNESGAAIKFDGLVGDAVLRESSGAASAYNAIPIQAATSLAMGTVVPPGPSGALEFNGTSYQEVTGKIIGSVRYDVINAAGIDQDATSLILLTLDTLANRFNYPTDVISSSPTRWSNKTRPARSLSVSNSSPSPLWA